MHRANLVGPLNLLELDRLPDRPCGHAKLSSRLFDQHVITLHGAQSTEKSGPIIDYSAGQFTLVPCIIIQSAGEKGGAVSKSKRAQQRWGIRFKILEKSAFRCHYCGTPSRETKLVIDHVVPLAKGGADHPSNMVASCIPCNGGKSDCILEVVA